VFAPLKGGVEVLDVMGWDIPTDANCESALVPVSSFDEGHFAT
jgi:hypothetical protein